MGIVSESGINIISLYSMKLVKRKILDGLAPMEDWDGWVSGGPSLHKFEIPVLVSDYLEPEYQKLGRLTEGFNDQLRYGDLHTYTNVS